MEASARNATDIARIVVVATCAASAGAHAGLIPTHFARERAVGVAFAGVVSLTLAIAVAMTHRPWSEAIVYLAGLVLAGLIAGFVFALQLKITMGGHGSLTREEARS